MGIEDFKRLARSSQNINCDLILIPSYAMEISDEIDRLRAELAEAKRNAVPCWLVAESMKSSMILYFDEESANHACGRMIVNTSRPYMVFPCEIRRTDLLPEPAKGEVEP